MGCRSWWEGLVTWWAGPEEQVGLESDNAKGHCGTCTGEVGAEMEVLSERRRGTSKDQRPSKDWGPKWSNGRSSRGVVWGLIRGRAWSGDEAMLQPSSVGTSSVCDWGGVGDGGMSGG